MSVRINPFTLSVLAVTILAVIPARGGTVAVERVEPPSSWVSQVEEDLARTEYRFNPAGAGNFSAPNRAHDLRTRASSHGLQITSRTHGADPKSGGWELILSMAAWGRGDRLTPVASASPQSDGARLTFDRGRLTEWYVNDERGLEQGFTLAGPPPGRQKSGEVVLEMTLTGTLLGFPAGNRGVVLRDGDGREILMIDGLAVADATGKTLPARFALKVGRLSILFDDTDAIYPVTVDPTFGAPNFSVYGTQASEQFGSSVATAGDVNGDGFSDFIVGAYQFDNGEVDEGRALVYHGGPVQPTGVMWQVESDQAVALMGRSVSTAGDVNGDGFDDVIVGSFLYDSVSINEGRADIYFGSTSGLSPTPNWSVVGSQYGSNFGYAVSTAGDVNGDGYADVLVGAVWQDLTQEDEGAVYLYLGSPSGPDTTPAWIRGSGQAFAALGNSVAGAGDTNGDGYDDVIVGALYYDNGQENEGAAWLFLGSATVPGSSPAWTGEGNQTEAWYGFSVAGAGDTNGDGYADIIVGAPYWDGVGPDEGIVRVYFGGSSGPDPTPDYSGRLFQAGALVGHSVGTAGDANGDGYAEIIVGAPYFSTPDLYAGRVFVAFGGAAGPELSASWWWDGTAGDQLGFSAATAGDTNGDGLSDLLIASPFYDLISADRGRVQWFTGRTSGLSASGVRYNGAQLYARFGQAVAGAGDVNGDGYSDVIVGAYTHDGGSLLEGRAYLYLGSASGLSLTPAWVKDGGQSAAYFGKSVAGAGDVNGDGYADVIVGAFSYSNGQSEEGAAFLYYGSPTGLSLAANWIAEGGQPGARWGQDVDSAGDVNGDGFADLIVGGIGWSNGQSGEGRAAVYLGGPAGPTPAPVWSVEGNQVSAQMGFSVGSAGDINGDGYSDVVVGAPLYDYNGKSNVGLASVFLGSASGVATNSIWDFTMLQVGAELGLDVGTAGDFNGDGYSDLLIGIPFDDYAGTDAGSAMLVWGGSSLLSPGYLFVNGAQTGGLHGARVATAGDVNGDGYSDFMVSSYLFDNGQTDEGKVYLYLGNSAGVLLGASTWQPEGNQVGANLGVALAATGDVNGDGFGDVVAGAWKATVSSTEEGSVFLYKGNEGLGRPRLARQMQADGYTLMDRFGLTQDQPAFRARLLGRTAAGRTRVRLQVEVRPLLTELTGTGLVESATLDTGLPAAGGSNVLLDESVGGLLALTPYTWRARTVSPNPYFPRTTWTSIPQRAHAETAFRTTAGCVDLDGDGYGNPGHISCPGGLVPDCWDLDSTAFPGGTEVCDALDNDCNGTVDDAPAPLGVSEVEMVKLAGIAYFQWLPDSESTAWDVVSGDLGLLKGTTGDFAIATTTCEANDHAASFVAFLVDPPLNQGWWYAMRRVNCGGVGTYDSLAPSQVGLRDPGINTSAGACP